MRLTDLDELLNKAVNLEEIALKQVNILNPNDDPIDLAIWMAVLVERTAFKEFLMDAPTVDAVPHRLGRWVYKGYRVTGGDAIGFYQCSECGHAHWLKEDNYCSNCGAKMEDLKNDH